MSAFFSAHRDGLLWVIAAYLVCISVVSAAVTVSDKRRAKRPGARRTPERTLLLFSALGGSAAMLLTMFLIRHKTRHIKFMLGIPIILLFQTVAALYVYFRVSGRV